MSINIKSLFALSLIIGCVYSTCTFSQIKNIVNNSLVFAGNVSTSETSTNNLYFLFYGVHGVIERDQLSTHPTFVVFGNPGSSSQYLNFGGFGPLTLTNNLTLIPNTNSPYNYANLLFIDPLGVGFSFASNVRQIPTSYLKMAQQVTYALTEFKKNVDFGKGKWIFVGQSSWIRSINGSQNIDDSLIGVVSLAPWGDLYDYGKYAGVAGVELGIITNGEKNTIETTFTTCYLYIRNGKFNEAHKCYDETLNYVQSKTNNRNLFNVNLNSTLIDTFSKIQYYLSVNSNAQQLLVDTTNVFERQSNYFQSNVYAEQAQSFSQNVTNFMRDYIQVKFFFISGTLDYLSYYKATRSWLEGLNFKQTSDFKSKAYENITIDGNVVGQGKSVKQVKYVQLQNAGHYLVFDQPSIVNSLLQQWVQGFEINNKKEIILSES